MNYRSLISRSLLFAATSFVALASFSAPANADETTAQQPHTLARICENIEAHFYSLAILKKVSWPKLCDDARAQLPVDPRRFSPLVNSLLAKLGTSHTAYYGPDEIDHALLLDVFRGNSRLMETIRNHYGQRPFWETPGFVTVKLDNRHFIDQIFAGSPADKSDLLTGDEIVKVDDADYHPVLSFTGKAGKDVKITYRRTRTGSLKTTNVLVLKDAPIKLLDEAAGNSIRVENIKDKRIGYIRFWSLAGGVEPQRIFRKALSFDQAGGMLDALVVDIRVLVGGGMIPLDVMAPITLPLKIKTRAGVEEGVEPSLKGKVVMIIDHHTRSAAELTAHIVSVKKLATLVGGRTQGAVTGGILLALPNGGVQYVAVAGLEYGGVELEGRGVKPDIEVSFSLPYSKGEDPMLNRALEQALKQALEQ
ncbi:MAG: PDZ domain-containing protein [Gammaproteobacteria bacterium]|nr:PDZ domain-containing protein [Gammaproteobacteria bacterium]